MLGTLKERMTWQRQKWAEETKERIREYAEFQRLESLKEIEKEEKTNEILHQEIDRYLKTAHPSFLLKPEVARALLNRLYARSSGRSSLSIHITREMRKASAFYNKEMVIFIMLLERKGVTFEGNEEKFMTIFMNKLSENNYRYCMEKYGDFVSEYESLEDAMYHYLEAVEENDKYESGHVDFFTKYLINKGILPAVTVKSKMRRRLKEFEHLHAEDYKVRKMEKRLQEIS
ncbi:hypothetical protein [Bacillus sp. FJAT-44742]|uniref:hypothetical protein n=1 Tax=Bacillus sp. FJAT-44742 TaxID=2014005 RepID=UPI000C23B72D|nr:hypothetical protein [Bacillus sp. FJAT-44742]